MIAVPLSFPRDAVSLACAVMIFYRVFIPNAN
jgi:hypothetical protein